MKPKTTQPVELGLAWTHGQWESVYVDVPEGEDDPVAWYLGELQNGNATLPRQEVELSGIFFVCYLDDEENDFEADPDATEDTQSVNLRDADHIQWESLDFAYRDGDGAVYDVYDGGGVSGSIRISVSDINFD